MDTPVTFIFQMILIKDYFVKEKRRRLEYEALILTLERAINAAPEDEGD